MKAPALFILIALEAFAEPVPHPIIHPKPVPGMPWLESQVCIKPAPKPRNPKASPHHVHSDKRNTNRGEHQ